MADPTYEQILARMMAEREQGEPSPPPLLPPPMLPPPALPRRVAPQSVQMPAMDLNADDDDAAIKAALTSGKVTDPRAFTAMLMRQRQRYPNSLAGVYADQHGAIRSDEPVVSPADQAALARGQSRSQSNPELAALLMALRSK